MGEIVIDSRLRERTFVFADRIDAAEWLAPLLKDFEGRAEEAVVLGIPAGGVPVALVLAERLGLPFDLIFVRKLHFPDNPETGFGALSEHGVLMLNEDLAAYLDKAVVERVVEEERRALQERMNVLRGPNKPLDLSGRVAIIVDDGLASGFTMLAAIREARKRGAARVLVAVPTASASAARLVAGEADGVYVANLRSGPRFAVAAAYTGWRDLALPEVRAMLRSWRKDAG